MPVYTNLDKQYVVGEQVDATKLRVKKYFIQDMAYPSEITLIRIDGFTDDDTDDGKWDSMRHAADSVGCEEADIMQCLEDNFVVLCFHEVGKFEPEFMIPQGGKWTCGFGSHVNFYQAVEV